MQVEWLSMVLTICLTWFCSNSLAALADDGSLAILFTSGIVLPHTLSSGISWLTWRTAFLAGLCSTSPLTLASCLCLWILHCLLCQDNAQPVTGPSKCQSRRYQISGRFHYLVSPSPPVPLRLLPSGDSIRLCPLWLPSQRLALGIKVSVIVKYQHFSTLPVLLTYCFVSSTIFEKKL